MEYCLWLRGTSGTKNGLRIQNAAIKSRKTAVPAGDDGVAPVIAVAVLIGMVVVAGAIIGFAMFAALGDASGTLPDVRFQASADGVSLYHAGGDALPLKSLVFYNTETKENVSSVQLTKCGSDKPATLTEWAVWETGDKIQFGEEGEGVLGNLSIVCMDSRNRPALLWMGSRAMTLPVGDMVPDVWGETIGGGEEKPDFPYEIFNSRSWKKFVTDAQKDWSTSVPEKTIFFDDNNGEYYYSYIPYSSHLTKEEALKNPSLDQFMELRPKGTVVKINLPPSAPDEMRKPADILNNGYNNYWADGKSPKMGTLFEDTQGKIYLWFEKDTNEYDQWSTTIPGAHWKLIGKEIFAS